MYDNTPYAPVNETPQRGSKRWLGWTVVAGVVLSLLLIASFSLRQSNLVDYRVPFIGADTGYTMCKMMAEDKTEATKGDSQPTQEEYKKLRQMFAESRYEAIRVNGVRFMDLLWQMMGMTGDKALAGLSLTGQVVDAYAGLTGGCAEHDLTIPRLGE